MPKLGGAIFTPDGSIIGSDLRQHMLFKLEGSSSAKIGGYFSNIENAFGLSSPGFSMSPSDLGSWCSANLGIPCGSPQYQAAISCREVEPVFCAPGTFCKPTVTPDFIYSNGDVGVGAYSGDGVVGALGSEFGTALNSPQALAISSNGLLVVADTGNNRIRKIDLLSKTITNFAGNGSNLDNGDGSTAVNAGIFHPRGLAFDSLGNLYISTENGFIRKVDPSGRITAIAGLPLSLGGVLSDEAPSNKMSFNKPSGLAFDNINQYLYVADTGSHRVIRIDIGSGIASTVAGNGSCSQTSTGDEGPALGASLCSPMSLGLDSSKNLLIQDSGHGRIRKVNFSASAGGTLAYAPTNKDLSKISRAVDGTFARTYRNGTKAIFNSSGYQTSVIDLVGRTTTYEYDPSFRITGIVDSTNQRTSYIYSGSLLNSIQDPAGRITRLNYAGTHLRQIVFPDGSSKQFDYSSDGLMIKETNEKGNSQNYVYNQWNRIEKIIDAEGNQVIVNDGVSGSMSNNFVNGTKGQLAGAGTQGTQVSDALTDAKGNTTELVRDHNGLVTTIKDAKGKISSIYRDLDGKPIQINNPDGSNVSFTYDPATGDLLSSYDSSTGATVSSSYDQYGNIVSSRDAKGYIHTKVFDVSTGLLVSEIEPGNKIKNYSYNSMGLVKTEATQLQTGAPLVVSMEYDSKGRLTKKTMPDGKFVEYGYDAAGNVTSENKIISVGVSSNTRFEFDAINRLTKVTSPKSDVTQYAYEPNGALSQITDAKGKSTTFQYNRKGRLIKKTDSSGGVYLLAYDENGNITSETDPKGNVKTITYDSMNNVAQAIYPDDVITYSYDDRGRIVQMKNKNSQIDALIDTKGNMTSVLVTGIGSMASYPSVTLNYSYDANGNRSGLSTSFGSVGYFYDGSNLLTQIGTSGGSNFGFGYDEANRLIQIQRPGSESTLNYVGSGLISSIIHSSAGSVKAFAQYDYDQRNYTTQKRTVAGNYTYSYDGEGQLSSVGNVGGNESFAYDAIGNRVSDGNGIYSYDAASQKLIEDWQYFYTYDLNGNLVQKVPKDSSKSATTYAYSSKNQLIEVIITDSLLGQIKRKINYEYDVIGRRIQKKVWERDAQLDPKQSYVRNFVYDGQNIILEFNGNNVVLASYLHSGLGSDDVLSTEITSTGVASGLATQSGTFFYLKDSIGSITDVTDSSGNIVQRYEYSGFGKLISIRDGSGTEITANPKLSTSYSFGGRERDPETGMYYLRARYYDPAMGRFLQADPSPGHLRAPNTMVNKYVYAVNNPILFTDPSGKDIWDEIGKVVIIAVAVVVAFYAGAFVAAYLGLSGLAGAAVGAGAGALAGGVVGAIGYSFAHANPSDGFRIGAALGFFAGAAGGFLGSQVVNVTPYTIKGSDVYGAVKGQLSSSAGGFMKGGSELVTAGAQYAGYIAEWPIWPAAAGYANVALPYVVIGLEAGAVNYVDHCISSNTCSELIPSSFSRNWSAEF